LPDKRLALPDLYPLKKGVAAGGGILSKPIACCAAFSVRISKINISKSFLLGKLLGIYVIEKEIIAFHLKLLHLRDHAKIPDWKMQEWEINLRPHNRTPIIAGVKVVAIRNQEGRLISLRWILRDISESKRTYYGKS